MQTALRSVSPAWLCHLSDSVLCTSLPALRAIQALCGLAPSAPLLQTPQLISLQNLSVQASQLHGMCNKTRQHCCCCLQAPCRGRFVSEHSDNPNCTSQCVSGGIHDFQQLTAASSSPVASLQQQLTHRQVRPWESCHPHRRQTIQLVLTHASQAQQRGFMTSSPVWQETLPGRKQQPNTQQPDTTKQQPGKQQIGKQQPGQQQPSGSNLEARGQPGSQAPPHARPSRAFRPRVSQPQSPAVPDASVTQPQSPPAAEKRVLRSFQQLQDQQQQQEQQQRQEHQQKLQQQQQQQQRSPTGFNRMSGPQEGAPFAPHRSPNGSPRGPYRPPTPSSDSTSSERPCKCRIIIFQ